MPILYIVLTAILVIFAVSIFIWVKLSKARISDNSLNSDNVDEETFDDLNENTGENS
jgi:multisubunit Na+/H+ antiporter MnhC subunit